MPPDVLKRISPPRAIEYPVEKVVVRVKLDHKCVTPTEYLERGDQRSKDKDGSCDEKDILE